MFVKTYCKQTYYKRCRVLFFINRNYIKYSSTEAGLLSWFKLSIYCLYLNVCICVSSVLKAVSKTFTVLYEYNFQETDVF